MTSEVKYSVHLPQTDFPMKANLATREPEIIKKWDEQKIYSKMLAARSGGPSFVMPDGPPYANGNIHLGHTLNKCLKDYVIKYKTMRGFRAPFIPGWDCHGLPIEHKVTKDLGKKRAEKSDRELRELCRQEAHKWVNAQREQFKRLGVIADWENPYLTLQSTYEAEEVRELARINENGVIYRGTKPVYWCAALQTALAEAEIEYAPHKSPSIYVKFPMIETAKKFGDFKKPVSCVIWTTTPWTLPANLGISLHPDFEYSFFDAGKEILFFAHELRESVEKECNVALTQIGSSVKGSALDRMTAHHPFYERASLFMLGLHVTLETGTGCVHTAPGHGQDDYIVGLQYDLPVLSPVDMYGKYTSEVPEYQGVGVFAANPLIVERLREDDRLLGFKEIEHSYPHCWRSKTPLIFRATPQWFMRMDDERFNIRAKAQKAIGEIKFVPGWGVKRLTAMIDNRPDWCLSRQRNWGVPIPAFTCQGCGEVHFNSKSLLKIADIMEREGGIEAYFEKSVADLLPDLQCEKCGGKDFDKNKDILDVWFDSGVCHAAVQRKRDGMSVPADLYLEGSDQHRGWFQTSLLSSIASSDAPPFKMLLTHNFVNDAKGRKMSKSLGNVVDPLDLIAKNGAEILRIWAASEDYGQDLNFSAESYNRVIEVYRRLRNSMRFLLGSLYDFDPKQALVSYGEMTPLDQYALHRLNELNRKMVDACESYEFFRAMQALNQYFTVELSAHYLDLLKDRLYTFKTDGRERRSAQTALWHILDRTVRLIAPFVSFLAEETYQHFKHRDHESVFLCDYPTPVKEWENAALSAEFEKMFEWRGQVTRLIEEKRQTKEIGSSLETQVTLKARGEDFKVLQHHEPGLCEFLIVSQVNLSEDKGAENVLVEVSPARGEKCPRCWNYSESIGRDPHYKEVCEKCVRALK